MPSERDDLGPIADRPVRACGAPGARLLRVPGSPLPARASRGCRCPAAHRPVRPPRLLARLVPRLLPGSASRPLLPCSSSGWLSSPAASPPSPPACSRTASSRAASCALARSSSWRSYLRMTIEIPLLRGDQATSRVTGGPPSNGSPLVISVFCRRSPGLTNTTTSDHQRDHQETREKCATLHRRQSSVASGATTSAVTGRGRFRSFTVRKVLAGSPAAGGRSSSSPRLPCPSSRACASSFRPLRSGRDGPGDGDVLGHAAPLQSLAGERQDAGVGDGHGDRGRSLLPVLRERGDGEVVVEGTRMAERLRRTSFRAGRFPSRHPRCCPPATGRRRRADRRCRSSRHRAH